MMTDAQPKNFATADPDLERRTGVTSVRDLSNVTDENWVCREWICTFCGEIAVSLRGGRRSVREGFGCPNCRAALRWRNQAAAILDAFARGRALSLSRALQLGLFDDLLIYEPAFHGPFVNAFRGRKNYFRSYFWEDLVPGATRDGIRCEDLTRLTYDDALFDLVITSDVFEHVFEPEAAFREIYRVLKPGGLHVFSLPVQWPFPSVSTVRARRSSGVVEHLLPPVYHRGGDGSDSLVVTDWGADLLSILDAIGFKTEVSRRSLPSVLAHLDVTFVSRKGW
jgi:SAM-dependent methyltransferase